MANDYRGSNSGLIAEAHRRGHAADTQTEIAPMCTCCGMKPEDQINRETPLSQLKFCSRCKSVQYCSKDCQTKHWPEHKKVCKQMAAQRKAREEAERMMQESETQKRIFALADEYPDDLPGQANALIQILITSTEGSNGSMTAIACANRLAEDLELLTECHNQGHLFYPVLSTLLEKDLQAIQAPVGTTLALPSWHMATGLLRCFPGEAGYVRESTTGVVSAYNEERCAAYFGTCWKAHLEFAVGLWKGVLSGSPDLYEVCKSFWRMTPMCLVHESVARAVFNSSTDKDDDTKFSNAQSPRLKPLLGMLKLNNMADDLEGLTNQVAALLVVHARNIRDSEVISAAELERSVTKRFDRYEKQQWQKLSLVVAKAMVDKKRQLTNDEFRRIMSKIHS